LSANPISAAAGCAQLPPHDTLLQPFRAPESSTQVSANPAESPQSCKPLARSSPSRQITKPNRVAFRIRIAASFPVFPQIGESPISILDQAWTQCPGLLIFKNHVEIIEGLSLDASQVKQKIQLKSFLLI
jgi:hypothetical protein